eukprot:4317541-Prymnesium_polylepis.3
MIEWVTRESDQNYHWVHYHLSRVRHYEILCVCASHSGGTTIQGTTRRYCILRVEELTARAKRSADEKFDSVVTKVARLKELIGEVETIVEELEGASELAAIVPEFD